MSTSTADSMEDVFKKLHRRRSPISVEELLEAYRDVGRASSTLDKFIESLTRGSGGRAVKKAGSKNPEYVCSILVDRSPSMEDGFKKLIGCVNNNIDKVSDYDGKVHFSLHLLSSRCKTIQEFDDDPKHMSDKTRVGSGNAALYDYIDEEVKNMSEYIKKKKIKDPKARILVFSDAQDKVSKIRSFPLSKSLKKAEDAGIIVQFGYNSKSSEQVAKRIGAVYKPLFAPPKSETFVE